MRDLSEESGKEERHPAQTSGGVIVCKEKIRNFSLISFLNPTKEWAVRHLKPIK